MANETQPTAPGVPGRSNFWGQFFNVVLLTGSAAATLVALAVLGAAFWWLYAPARSTSEPVAVRPPAQLPPAAIAPASQQSVAAAPAPPVPAAVARSAAALGHAMPSAVAPAAEAAAPSAQARPRGQGYKLARDAEMSRGIAQGLQQLAQDPSATRQLGTPDQ